ncbi:MAG: hypothetical protein ACOY33_12895 [Pseudomonadota bacterium]
MKRTASILIMSAILLVSGWPAAAGTVTGLTTFTAGTPAKAAEVNGNFTAVKTAVDDNDARIAALEALVAALDSRIDALEAKLASVSTTTVNGNPTVRFSGVNVQVVNGLGSTTTANGTGNVIIGYDEAHLFLGINICSIGTHPTDNTPVTDETTCTAVGGTWGHDFKTGSHYLVSGRRNSYSRWGGIVGGDNNSATYNFASVLGGQSNMAGGPMSVVSGGTSNKAIGNLSSISGGSGNTASGGGASVTGGFLNTASGSNAQIAGGRDNSATAEYSQIGGGNNNIASADSASVSGGQSNTASGGGASVSGGSGNIASGLSSHVSGGSGNTASHTHSSILGSTNQDSTFNAETIPALP